MISGGEYMYGYVALLLTVICTTVLVFLGASYGSKKVGSGGPHIDTTAGDEGED